MGVFAEYIGNMNISEEKREKFTECVLEILRQGGMMQCSQLALYNRKIILIQSPVLDEEGETEFSYNYFEDDVWETAVYCSSNNHFWTNIIGSRQFNRVILAVYVLYEFYADDFGMVLECGEIIDARFIIGWLNHLFHEKYTNERLSNLWEVYELLHKNEYEYAMSEFFYLSNMEETDFLSWVKFIYVDKGMEGLEFIINKLQIKDVGKSEELIRLKNLIIRVNSEIKEMKDLSELSQKKFTYFCQLLPAEIIIKVIAEAFDLEFWSILQKFKNDVEFEAIPREKNRAFCKPVQPVETADFLGKRLGISDDDRAYFWKQDGDVHFSESMKCWLKSLQAKYNEIIERKWVVLQGKEFINKLVVLLSNAEKIYHRIYAFQDMFFDYMMHANEETYQASILLLENMINGAESRVWIKRYLAVLANPQLRKMIFEF